MLTCRQASRLLSDSRDRKLGLGERITLRLHLTICDGCTQFDRQLDVIRQVLRRYRDRDEPGDAAPPTDDGSGEHK